MAKVKQRFAARLTQLLSGHYQRTSTTSAATRTKPLRYVVIS